MKATFGTVLDAKTLSALCGSDADVTAHGALTLRTVCTDSREADAESVFVALRGERVDGHDYIGVALERGCRCVICERSSEEILASSALAIVVKDSELALSSLANAYKKTLSFHGVAVTGSVGKTTTKDMIASVLSQGKRIYKSVGNYNSVIGMPLSVTEIDKDCEYAVLEMGMSAFGEIERMSLAAEPEIAVITNIGSSHMEMLGSRENICRAKLEILCGLCDGGTLLLNGDEPLLANVGGKSYRTLYVSLHRSDADFFAQNIRVENGCTRFDLLWEGGACRDLLINVPGRHNVYAALYAFACGVLAGLSEEQIRQGLLDYVSEGMRQNIYGYKDLTIYEDCYNASPESVKAAIDVLTEQHANQKGRCIAVLGDMLELGQESERLHREVGAYAHRKGVDLLVTFGPLGARIAMGALMSGMDTSRIVKCIDREDITEGAAALAGLLRAGDTVLIKASRSVKLERVAAYLKEHYE